MRWLTCSFLATALAAASGDALASEGVEKPMRWKSLTFRCAVAEGPKLQACKPLKTKGIDPEVLVQSQLDVEAIPACRLAGLKPGTLVDHPFSYSDDPRFLKLPRPLVVITNPDWAEPPPLDAIARLYPAQALMGRLTGRVVIGCRVTVSGTVQDCKVVEEAPTGQGFGEAGLQALALMRFRPQRRDCTPTDQGTIRIPLVFSPPPSTK